MFENIYSGDHKLQFLLSSNPSQFSKSLTTFTILEIRKLDMALFSSLLKYGHLISNLRFGVILCLHHQKSNSSK